MDGFFFLYCCRTKYPNIVFIDKHIFLILSVQDKRKFILYRIFVPFFFLWILLSLCGCVWSHLLSYKGIRIKTKLHVGDTTISFPFSSESVPLQVMNSFIASKQVFWLHKIKWKNEILNLDKAVLSILLVCVCIVPLKVHNFHHIKAYKHKLSTFLLNA